MQPENNFKQTKKDANGRNFAGIDAKQKQLLVSSSGGIFFFKNLEKIGRMRYNLRGKKGMV